MTPEQRAKANATARALYRARTPEQKAHYRQKNAARMRAIRANSTGKAAVTERVHEYLRTLQRNDQHWLAGLKVPDDIRRERVTKARTMPQADVLRLVYAVAPKGALREEAVAELTIALLSGDFAPEELPRAARRFQQSIIRRERFTFLSLDTPIMGTEGLRLIDTIPAPETVYG